jgi:hypothetical protein
MSGNPALDRQIMQAVQPQFNPMQAIQQMQRQPVQMQPVQNPVFGGSIPMNFGLPQAAQIPTGYVPRLASFQPSQAPIPAPPAPMSLAQMLAGSSQTSDYVGSPNNLGYGDN